MLMSILFLSLWGLYPLHMPVRGYTNPEKEKEDLISKDSSVECCIRRYVGAKDFLNNNEVRYCLWLKDISPSIYAKNKEILSRLERIRNFRLQSTAAPTRKSAEQKQNQVPGQILSILLNYPIKSCAGLR